MTKLRMIITDNLVFNLVCKKKKSSLARDQNKNIVSLKIQFIFIQNAYIQPSGCYLILIGVSFIHGDI